MVDQANLVVKKPDFRERRRLEKESIKNNSLNMKKNLSKAQNKIEELF
jgi:hypothetical protein